MRSFLKILLTVLPIITFQYCGDNKPTPLSNVTVTTLAGSDAGYADGAGGNAKFYTPTGVAVDASGNVYVADLGNHKIRKVTPDGNVSTLAGSTAGYLDGQGTSAKFNKPADVAVDANGNIYVADYSNNKIRKITSDGTVSTLAGTTYGYAKYRVVAPSWSGFAIPTILKTISTA